MSECSASKRTFIYGLCDPRDGALRYVGKSDEPDFRLYIHIWDATHRPRVRLHGWIRGLAKCGVAPDQFIIEECADRDWIEAETFWIAYFRFLGCDLVNHTAGGEGLWNPSAEVRAKMSERQRGKTRAPEVKAHLSAVMQGERNPFYGRAHNAETKAKIGSANRRASVKKGEPQPSEYYESLRKTYVCTSPEGEECTVTDLTQFCRERGLTRSNMVSVASGKWRQHKGWQCRRLQEGPRVRYIVTTPRGADWQIENLEAFCRQAGLSKQGFYSILNGKTDQYRGWRIRRPEDSP